MDESQDQELTAGVIEVIRSATKKLTGFARRQFQAEVANRYCEGSPKRTEQQFGWGRENVNTGINELRTGIRCVEAFQQRGRRKTEAVSPQLAQDIRAIVEPTAQADPKFQTTLAYTRITAQKVYDELFTVDPARQDVPTRQTVGEILNRLGDCLQRVLKTKPQKKWPRPMRSSRTSPPRGKEPRPTRRACGSRSTAKPSGKSARFHVAARPARKRKPPTTTCTRTRCWSLSVCSKCHGGPTRLINSM